jgi:hypothetical protein
MGVWATQLARAREEREAKGLRRERRLRCEARWGAKTAARAPSQESDRDDSIADAETDDGDATDRDSFDDAASAAGSE